MKNRFELKRANHFMGRMSPSQIKIQKSKIKNPSLPIPIDEPQPPAPFSVPVHVRHRALLSVGRISSSQIKNQNSKFKNRPLFSPRYALFLLLSSVFLLSGCTSPRPLRGGHALTVPKPGGLVQTLAQGENPSAPSRQTQENIRTRTYSLPPSVPFDSRPSLPAPLSSPRHSTPDTFLFQPPAPQPSSLVLVSEREESRAATELGAAQKDTARAVGAKLSSLKPLIWVGLVMFVFGIASAFWKPLRFIVGSVTTSAAITVGGLALMLLP